MMMETKILMNLAPHPNICQIYGVTAAGSDAFLSRGKEGFYIILDRLVGTMIQRLNEWRTQQQQEISTRQAKGDDDKVIAMQQYQRLMQRLEVALDIGSALLFLSDRQIVFHLRPDKVGFDARYGRIKLIDFGQARENGQLDQAPSLNKTDDIRTLAYTAPEVLCQAPVTVAADVYAYGIVLWEMLSLKRPFEGMSRAEHFEQVIMDGERPPLSDDIPKAVQDLISECWNPHLRPTMKKVYDSVEEVLLYQADKPEIFVLPGLNRVHSELITKSEEEDEQPSSKTGKRQLRRTKTEDDAYSNTKNRPDGARRASRRQSHNHNDENKPGEEPAPTMKDRSKSSNHENGGGRSSRRSRRDRPKLESGNEEDRSKNTNDDSFMSDPSMRDHSKPMRDDSNGSAGMKDKSKNRERVSRKPRATRKPAAEEADVEKAESEAPLPELGEKANDATAQGEAPKSLPGLRRSATTERAPSGTKSGGSTGEKLPPRTKAGGSTGDTLPPRTKSGGSTSSGDANAPAFGRSQTTSGARRSRR
jgi:Protein tyrosine and serine/threonine kinase